MLYHEDILGLCDADSQFYGDIIGFGEEMSELALWPYVEVIAQTQPGQAILLALYLAGGCALHGRKYSHSPPKKREPFFGVAEIQNHFLRPGAFRARSFQSNARSLRTGKASIAKDERT